MTVKERIDQILWQDEYNMDDDRWQKLVIMAYYMGRESATRAVSDLYRGLIGQMLARADACRYSHMAHQVIGDQYGFYLPDYAGDMTTHFGSDETRL